MCHVLIIEDNLLIANDLAYLAIGAGATSTDVAISPDEALTSALAQYPAVLFSDVHIIGGTGPEAVNAIRQRLGMIPVIFITATPHAYCDVEAAALPIKPVARLQLFKLFRSLMTGNDKQAFELSDAKL